jgi:hypothetical protein
VILQWLGSNDDVDGGGEGVEEEEGMMVIIHLRRLTVVVTVPLVRVKGGDLVFGLVLGPVERRDIRWEGTVLVGASEILLGITILERVVRGVQRRPRSRRPRLGQGLDQLGADR